jgi:protein-S-isoprenylcysteine O-methyltransferase Ste14
MNLGMSFGVLPKKQKRIKTGFYKYLRHPMYVGIWSTFLGLSLANASWQGLVFLNILMTPLLFIRAIFEDKKLTD